MYLQGIQSLLLRCNYLRTGNSWTRANVCGKLFFYMAFVMLHRWVCAHVWRFHLLSKQWSCEWTAVFRFYIRAVRVHSHRTYIPAICKRHVEKQLTNVCEDYFVVEVNGIFVHGLNCWFCCFTRSSYVYTVCYLHRMLTNIFLFI